MTVDVVRPAPPAVPCRDATAEEIPGEAAKAATRARNNGFSVRVTYARAESSRVGPHRGRCHCGAVVRLYQETGMVFPHDVPMPTEKISCTGSTLNEFGACAECGGKARLLKTGGLNKHYVKPVKTRCSNDERPDEVIPGEPLAGTHSIAVRVKGLGVGTWTNDKFSGAWMRCSVKIRMYTDEEGQEKAALDFTIDPDGPCWGPVSSSDFQSACATRRPK